jgi:hypothetical protein
VLFLCAQEGIRIRWYGGASNPVEDVRHAQVGSTPAALRHKASSELCTSKKWHRFFPQIAFFSAKISTGRLDFVAAPLANTVLGHAHRGMTKLLMSLSKPELSVLSVLAMARRSRNWKSLSATPAARRASLKRQGSVSNNCRCIAQLGPTGNEWRLTVRRGTRRIAAWDGCDWRPVGRC